jgi:mRNA-degrading endonuclease RelE of RelBE toxin-antitoxin system
MASDWRLTLTKRAERQYEVLDEDVQADAVEAMAELIEEPFPPGSIAMAGYKNRHRVRFHKERYRLVYDAFPASRKLVVVAMGPRATIYRGMRKST